MECHGQTTLLVHAGTSVGIVFAVVVVISVFVCIEIVKDSRGNRRGGGVPRQPERAEAVYKPVWMPSIHISSQSQLEQSYFQRLNLRIGIKSVCKKICIKT
jgi:hypothetical protein